MLFIEFGKSENTTLDLNSMFIIIRDNDREVFNKQKERLKTLPNRIYNDVRKEWEVPYCYFKDVMEMFKDTQIVFRNEQPKAVVVSHDDIINGLDFNGYNLYDYQLDGVKYGLEHQSFLLLDEQRIRKNTSSNSFSKIQKRTQRIKALFNSMWG